MSSAWLVVTEQWGSQFRSLHNDFPVAIDGKLSEGEEEERTKVGWRKRWSVEPGTHTLRLGRGWLKSPEVSFTVVAYQTARFVARNRSVFYDDTPASVRWQMAYSGFFLVCSVFKHDLWITVRPVDRSIGL